MAGSLNKILLIGSVGRDPELRYTPAGKAVTQFSLATNHRYTPPDGGEPKETTEWFRIVAWDRLAETCNQLVKKGRKLYVEGRLQTRKWQGQDGQDRYTTEVVASTVLVLDRPQQQGNQGGSETTGGEFEPEDIPFGPSVL